MTLQTVIRRLESDYPSDMFLGRIAWYTITGNAHVDHGIFAKALIDNGIDESLPSPPRDGDVFKRACTAAQTHRHSTEMIDGEPQPVKINYMIRPIKADAKGIVRRLVSETVNSAGLTLDYAELADITFDRTVSQIVIDGAKNVVPEVRAILDEVQRLYVLWSNSLTPYTMREFIRGVIRRMGATILRDGVYFIPEVQAESIERLEMIVNETIGSGSSMHSLPMLDDSKQREMLRMTFEDESIGEVDSMLADIRGLDRDAPLSPKKFVDFKSRYDDLRLKVSDYSDLLDDALGGATSRLEIMETCLFEILGRVR